MLLQRFSPLKKNGIRAWWRESALGLYLLFSLLFGGYPSQLFHTPPDLLFFEFYIKDVLLAFFIICIFWTIQQSRPKPERIREFHLLNSLPLTDRQLGLHFLVQSFWQYFWVPAISILLIYALLPYAPFVHILRVGLSIFLLYAILIVVNPILHLLFRSKKHDQLSGLNPIIVTGIVFVFAIGNICLVLLDTLVSGWMFWIDFVLVLLFLSVLFTFYIRLFVRWHKENRIFCTAPEGGMPAKRRSHVWQWHLPPLLYKNILKIERDKSPFIMILTGLFLLCAYLVSRNNQRLDDFMAILFTTAIFYAIVYAAKSQQALSENTESPQVFHSVALRKIDIYFAAFLPTAIWLFMITFVFTLLALSAHAGLKPGLIFAAKSLSVSLGFQMAALNLALAAYPDGRAAQRYFFYWGLVLLVSLALFYKFRYVLFIGLVLLTFVRLITKKLYRV